MVMVLSCLRLQQIAFRRGPTGLGNITVQLGLQHLLTSLDIPPLCKLGLRTALFRHHAAFRVRQSKSNKPRIPARNQKEGGRGVVETFQPAMKTSCRFLPTEPRMPPFP